MAQSSVKGSSRYYDIPNYRPNDGKSVIRSVLYPPIPRHDMDTYVLSQSGDTLYALAQKYYEDVNLYWVIGEANENLKKYTQNVPPGLQLRIPSQLSTILRDFEDLNNPLI